MNSKKMKSSPKGRLPLHVYLAYLLVCTFLLTGVSFSRYITTSTAGDSARVAKGAVTVEANTAPSIEISQDAPNASFDFTVSNHGSEVAIRYDVVVTLDKQLEGVTVTLDEQTATSGASNEYIFSNAGIFAAGVAESKKHTLSFTADSLGESTETETEYKIEISIRSQQID